LHYHEAGRPDAKGKVDADVQPRVRVVACVRVDLRPLLEPHTTPYVYVSFQANKKGKRKKEKKRNERQGHVPICAVCAATSVMPYTATAYRLLILAYSIYTAAAVSQSRSASRRAGHGRAAYLSTSPCLAPSPPCFASTSTLAPPRRASSFAGP
jgi:hypothetical protein